ncbi:MAG: gliding motility-associated C-terminal domain-containing protein, partial [Flavobacteriales bacterium]
PNEDGLNDIFFVKGDNIYDFELYVFNRWGEVIFHSTDMNNGWNGKRNNNMQDAQIDVYVWKVTYKYWKDVHEDSRHREPVGTVSLIK